MKKVVVTIHGIHWTKQGDWQNKIGQLIKKEDSLTTVLHFRYGRIFGVFSWWLSFTRKVGIPRWARHRYINKFKNFLLRVQEKFPSAKISVIAHSFGGWITEETLKRSDEINLQNVIFVHCPISSHIESTSFWNWLELEKIKNVFSWSSHKDFVIGKIAIAPFGQNGYWGFIRNRYVEDRKEPKEQPYPINLYNIHTEERHSGVLNKLNTYFDKIWDQLNA